MTDDVKSEDAGLATTVLIGAVVAAIEPELLLGMLIGAAAALGPRLLPTLGTTVRPAAKAIVRAGMAVQEMAAEATEQVQDLMAEVRSEQGAKAASPRPTTAKGRSSAPRRSDA
jgi:hypothetical protein